MTINEIVAAYIDAKEEQKVLNARVKELTAIILDTADGRSVFDTDDYTVTVSATESLRLDTDALYKDFPDIKATYGKVSTSRSVKAFSKASAGKVPA